MLGTESQLTVAPLCKMLFFFFFSRLESAEKQPCFVVNASVQVTALGFPCRTITAAAAAAHRCCQSNVFGSEMLQTHHPESLHCLWGRATLCQTVGLNSAHHHGDPSIGQCVWNLAALLIPHSVVCVLHTFLSVSLLFFLLLICVT